MIDLGKVLFVGAHPDDIEINAAGTLRKLMTQGVMCYMMTLSGVITDREKEQRKSWKILSPTNARIHSFDNGLFYLSEKEIIGYIDKFIREFNIDTIFTHHPADTHQDHRVTAMACLSAGRNIRNVVHFHPTWPSGRPTTAFSVDLISEFGTNEMNYKMRALSMHESQIQRYGGDAYVTAVTYVDRGNAITHTGKLDTYAELFEINRIIF